MTGARIRKFLKDWQAAIVLTGGIISGLVAFYQWDRNRSDEIVKAAKANELLLQTRADTENLAAKTRKLEAQRPFLQKQLDIYLETMQTTGKLTNFNIMPNTPEWDDNVKRFWQLRWGELEMVGDAGLRQAARRVAEQLNEVEFKPNKERHDLRWMVECLADEVRLSLEHSWGYERTPLREMATHELVSKLPTGCTSGRRKPALLDGMQALESPENLGPRDPPLPPH